MHYTELDTPCLIIDLDVLEKNIRSMQEDCDRLGIGLRAHIKTHKTPKIAQMQVLAGAIGICCQKLGEAEVMSAAGIKDILIPYNIVGFPKLHRLSRLIKQGASTITVAADSIRVVEGLSRQAKEDGCTIRIVVEMDLGGRRCGTQSPQDTLNLAQQIHGLPGLEFMGVMFYKNGEQGPSYLEEVRELIDRAGFQLNIISGGGTGAQAKCKTLGCTEARVGSYAYEGMTRTGRREQLDPERNPLRVVVTVVSAVRPGKIVVDGGRKSFTSSPAIPYGYCIEHPEIFLGGMHVEHGHVDISQSDHTFKVGDVLSFIPHHGGMTTNLYDRIYAVREGEVSDTWEVAGRGKAQ